MSSPIPARLNIRVDDDARAAVEIMIAAVSAPHRRPASISDAVRAALMIAARTVREREGVANHPGGVALTT